MGLAYPISKSEIVTTTMMGSKSSVISYREE